MVPQNVWWVRRSLAFGMVTFCGALWVDDVLGVQSVLEFRSFWVIYNQFPTLGVLEMYTSVI